MSTTTSEQLSLEPLFAMTPDVLGQDVARLAARHLFLGHVKTQKPVHETFFPTTPKHLNVDGPECPLADVARLLDDITWFDFSRYSVLYVATAICRLGDCYGIHTMLDEELVSEHLQAMYDSFHWKKLGFSLYTTLFCDMVKDERTKIAFKEYLNNNPRLWARRMCERIRDQQWVQTHFTRHRSLEQNTRDVNMFIIKLHLLDPTAVLPAFNCLLKALPDLNLSLDLATTNYLGDPLPWTLIREDVIAAIRRPSYPSNVSPLLTTDALEHYYGIQVCEFILVDCHELGVWTGQYPDNKRISHFRDRCRVM